MKLRSVLLFSDTYKAKEFGGGPSETNMRAAKDCADPLFLSLPCAFAFIPCAARRPAAILPFEMETFFGESLRQCGKRENRGRRGARVVLRNMELPSVTTQMPACHRNRKIY